MVLEARKGAFKMTKDASGVELDEGSQKYTKHGALRLANPRVPEVGEKGP